MTAPFPQKGLATIFGGRIVAEVKIEELFEYEAETRDAPPPHVLDTDELAETGTTTH